MNTKRTTITATLTAVAFLAAGCQSDSKAAAPIGSTSASAPAGSTDTTADNSLSTLSADEILQRTKSALSAANSFHVKGVLKNDSDKDQEDIKVSGSNAAGSISIGAAKIALLRVGGEMYIKPNAEFWAKAGMPNAKTTVVAQKGRWVKVAKGDSDWATLLDGADPSKLLHPSGKITKGATKTIAGVPTIELIDHGTDAGSLFIATTGQPYPLQITGPGGASLTISEFGQKFEDVTAPTADQVIDLSSMTGSK